MYTYCTSMCLQIDTGRHLQMTAIRRRELVYSGCLSDKQPKNKGVSGPSTSDNV